MRSSVLRRDPEEKSRIKGKREERGRNRKGERKETEGREERFEEQMSIPRRKTKQK